MSVLTSQLEKENEAREAMRMDAHDGYFLKEKEVEFFFLKWKV